VSIDTAVGTCCSWFALFFVDFRPAQIQTKAILQPPDQIVDMALGGWWHLVALGLGGRWTSWRLHSYYMQYGVWRLAPYSISSAQGEQLREQGEARARNFAPPSPPWAQWAAGMGWPLGLVAGVPDRRQGPLKGGARRTTEQPGDQAAQNRIFWPMSRDVESKLGNVLEAQPRSGRH
jgi:hypothetical protein